jgi:hypothetical protein
MSIVLHTNMILIWVGYVKIFRFCVGLSTTLALITLHSNVGLGPTLALITFHFDVGLSPTLALITFHFDVGLSPTLALIKFHFDVGLSSTLALITFHFDVGLSPTLALITFHFDVGLSSTLVLIIVGLNPTTPIMLQLEGHLNWSWCFVTCSNFLDLKYISLYKLGKDAFKKNGRGQRRSALVGTVPKISGQIIYHYIAYKYSFVSCFV